MTAYLPNNATVVGIVLAGLVATLAAGYGITRLRSILTARIAAWLLVIAAVGGFERLTSTQPPGFRMLAIIGVLLYAMKAVVSVESQTSGDAPLRLFGWCAFAALWFGMRPSLFVRVPGPARDGAWDLCRMGFHRLILGAGFFALARMIYTLPGDWCNQMTRLLLATICLLPGLSLMLHFGAFNLIAGFWRRFGANCRPLFRAPLLSKSLTEFWGQRWNLGFSEMTALGVFRPLRSRFGSRSATAVAFLFSGLLHELAISVPVMAGFGLPLLYFTIHAVAMFIEQQLERKGRPIYRSAWLGRAWTTAWLVIPLPILFHMPFLTGCVWPLIGVPSQ